MLAKRPPLGWNTWNTFGKNISDQLIRETADIMVEKGFRDAGYEYIIIDDCWSLRERDEQGYIVPDPEKFPNGMKAVADYVHSKGFKFGMYSCVGLRTCAGYPSSYGHEFEDAQRFAEWGVDYLKFDYCYFPTNADCKAAYARVALALKATGRDIWFAACNWGEHEPWDWMRSVGAHSYRSTHDIHDNFTSFSTIAKAQIEHLSANSSGCFNDMDMLTVGMHGKGLAAFGDDATCTFEEYKTQFGLWCYFGVPLILGNDVRIMDDECRALVQNPRLLALNQDEETRAPFLFSTDRGVHQFFRHLANNRFAIGLFNLSDHGAPVNVMFDQFGLPLSSGYGLHLTDLFTGEDLGVHKDDYFIGRMDAHTTKLIGAELVKV